MEITIIPITELKPATYNPRRIARETLRTLKRNIEEFGFIDPMIVNKDLTIIGGHQRHKAALELGMKELPCVVLDLSKSRERALNLALNKISGEWDKVKLELLLKSIEDVDLSFTGFNEDELIDLIKDEKPETPQYDIAPRLMEKHNYVVLFFDNVLDFQVACEIFSVKMMREDTRQHVGLGKAIDGKEYLRKIGK
jgi:hypothetical protein